jgi:hypothetical protein
MRSISNEDAQTGETPMTGFSLREGLRTISASDTRANVVQGAAGRGSSIEAYPLFGFDLIDYDSLLSEKLDLLLKIRENTHVHWTGKHRSRDRRSIHARCRILCLFGSA